MRTRLLMIGFAVALVFTAMGQASALVNLEWRPAQSTVAVGESVYLDLYAVSDNSAGDEISAIEVVMLWDPTTIDFWGVVNEPLDYWLNDGFMSMNGGFNDDPYFDGDALYTAWANLGENVLVSNTGLYCATFEWVALQPTSGTQVTLPASYGGVTSMIYDGMTIGNNIAGNLGSATIAVTAVPEPGSIMALCAGLLSLVPLRKRMR